MNAPPKKSENQAPAKIKTPQELIHIKHKITLRQYKYWILMVRAYRTLYESGQLQENSDFCRISISDLHKWLGYDPMKAELRVDLEAIRKESIIYNVLGKDGEQVLRGAGFISEWELSSKWIGFKLPSFLRECIERLDLRGSIFQELNWTVFNSFSGKYEAILYKLCKDYVGATRTPYMSIEAFREYMGVKVDEYTDFKRLNQWVISSPIKRINESELSDIVITTQFRREARKIIGIWFEVEFKSQTAMDFGDDPAFRFARVGISIAQQRKYLASKSPELVASSILRANEYADGEESLGKEVNLGALYRKAIEEDWGFEYESKKARSNEKEKAKKATQTAKQEELRQKEEIEAKRKAETTAFINLALSSFEEMPEEQQDKLRKEFSLSLVPVERNGFEKYGEGSKVYRYRFANFLREKKYV